MDRKPFDYSWIVFLVIVVIIIIAFRPVMHAIKGAKEKSATNSDWAKGKVIFYDTKAWGRDNRSCAMCHAKDFTLQEGFNKVDMLEPAYVELKGLKKTYGLGALGTEDKLLQQVNKCLSSSNRIEAGTIDMNDQRWTPLAAYLIHSFS